MMKKKKKYVKPASELIQVVCESNLLRFSIRSDKRNWLNDKDMQIERPSSMDFGAPVTRGDMKVEPGGDIDFGSKTNPWGSWDE